MIDVKRIFVFPLMLGLLLLSACSSQATKDERNRVDSKPLTPAEAIALALVAKTDEGVEGFFEFKVLATGVETRKKSLGAPTYFLNSELDYRSDKCLTVRVSPQASEAFKKSHGISIDTYMKDKTIVVHGTVKRTKIIYKRAGKPTGKFYYQNHIVVNSVEQIKVVSG